jgi:HEPN domain-containing protein
VTSPLDRAEFERWRAQAASALETAALARKGGRCEWACFLCEQAAQLAVKGILHAVGLDAWGHDLAVLAARARDAHGAAFSPPVQDAAVRLSRHYIPTRYPDAHASGAPSLHYTDADAEQATRDACDVLAAVDRAWTALEASR